MSSLKITPDIIVGGADGAGGGNIFAAFIAQLLARNRELPPQPPQQ